MSPLNFLTTRSYKTWPIISLSAMGYTGIVYSEYSGANLARRKNTWSVSHLSHRQIRSDKIFCQDLVRAIVHCSFKGWWL